MSATTAVLLEDAVHHHRPISRQGLMERLFTLWFRGFVYNQIWEDPRVDAEALGITTSSRILTISSGGCNVLNYLIREPEKIVAIDLNRAHLSLTRLKLAALRWLPDYADFYEFFAVGKNPANLERYRTHLRDRVDPEVRRFWERSSWPTGRVGPKRISYFSRGFYDYGKLGLFLRFVHGVARVVGVRPEEFLQAASIEEQQHYFDRVIAPFFDNGFVRWVGKRPATVYSLGIPPSQHQVMRDEWDGHLIDLYRERIRKLTCAFPLSDNYFAWQAFGRCYNHDRQAPLPDYLNREHYAALRDRLDRVETHQTTLHEFLRAQPAGSFDSFVLLDAQDWMPPPKVAELWHQIERVGAPGSRVIFRTAGKGSPVEAALPGSLRRRFDYLEDRSLALHEQDRSAIYGMFHLYRKKD